MIVKAYINKIINNSTYEIRIPSYDKVSGASLDSFNLSVAKTCLPIGCEFKLNIEDIVVVDFENNDRSKPIIVGIIDKFNDSDIKVNSLKIINNAIFSKNIEIGEISSFEISCLENTHGNINNQIKNLNDEISNLERNVSTLDENYSLNLQTYETCIKDLEKNKSIIDNISRIVGNNNDKSADSVIGKINNCYKDIIDLENIIGNLENGSISTKIDNVSTTVINAKESSVYTDVSSSDESSNSSLSQSIVDVESNSFSGKVNGYTKAQSATFSSIIGALRSKFPHGKYWNHMPVKGTGASYNNQDGWTDIPCPRHDKYRGHCGTKGQTCNGYAPDKSETSWQCMGYANKCGYDVTGYDPEKSKKWKKTTNPDDLKDLKKGDIIRYKNDGHSIYVTDVNGSTVTYTDCNSDLCCVIRWDAKIDKSTIKKSFSYIRISPTDLSNSRLLASKNKVSLEVLQ